MPVAKLLNEKGIAYKVQGKDYVISCLNPEHDDSNPSCRVDRVSGVAHCFSCGWKGNLFKFYGVFTNTSSIRVAALKEKLKELAEGVSEIEFPPQSSPFNESFRDISVKTLRRFEAFHTEGIEKLKDRIVFPIRDVSGKLVSFIGRHVLSNANPRYVVHPSGKPLPLFPSKMPENTTSVVFVEGIFDMLNMQDKGVLNTVCCFGTSTISSKNVSQKMLPFKVQGITKVYILFDADKAGQEAAKELKPLLEKEGYTVEILDLEEDCDPGMLGAESIGVIKDYIKCKM
jgi:DNA primase